MVSKLHLIHLPGDNGDDDDDGGGGGDDDLVLTE